MAQYERPVRCTGSYLSTFMMAEMIAAGEAKDHSMLCPFRAMVCGLERW
jgi:hypothetical protein